MLLEAGSSFRFHPEELHAAQVLEDVFHSVAAPAQDNPQAE